MISYILIGDNANSDDLVEVPSEEDGSLLLSSVSAQFPGSVGLRFRSERGAWRGLRVTGNKVDPPADGWGTRHYYVVKQAPKRTIDESTVSNNAPTKQSKDMEDTEEGPFEEGAFLEKYHVPDLMIAGLPRDATDEEIREYFEHFGKLEQFSIKRQDDGRMRGFGFIKFRTSAATKAVLNMDHFIHNRHIDVRYSKRALEMLQMGYGLECMPNDNIPTKLFVGRMPMKTTVQDLQQVFVKYGPLRDVYIPPNANGRFAFVTFGSVAAAFRAMNDVHQLNGQYLQLSTANNKKAGENMENDVNTNGAGGDESMETDQNRIRPSLKIDKHSAKNWNMTSFLMDNMHTMSAQNKQMNSQVNPFSKSNQPPLHQHQQANNQPQSNLPPKSLQQNQSKPNFGGGGSGGFGGAGFGRTGGGYGNGTGGNGIGAGNTSTNGYGGSSGGVNSSGGSCGAAAAGAVGNSSYGGNFNTPYGGAYGYANFTSFGGNSVWGQPR